MSNIFREMSDDALLDWLDGCKTGNENLFRLGAVVMQMRSARAMETLVKQNAESVQAHVESAKLNAESAKENAKVALSMKWATWIIAIATIVNVVIAIVELIR